MAASDNVVAKLEGNEEEDSVDRPSVDGVMGAKIASLARAGGARLGRGNDGFVEDDDTGPTRGGSLDAATESSCVMGNNTEAIAGGMVVAGGSGSSAFSPPGRLGSTKNELVEPSAVDAGIVMNTVMMEG